MSVDVSRVPPILTLTGNLLAERTLEFDRWEPGRTQRAMRESFQVGGKGINVSKMLTRLRVSNTALCFTGGAAGVECEAWLRAHGFHFHAFASTTPTRCGTVVRETFGRQPETTFLGPDSAPDAAAVRRCVEFLEAQQAGTVLVACGSFPGWQSPAFEPLRTMIKTWRRKGPLIVDTYGAPLTELVQSATTLLKINADELASLGFTSLGSLSGSLESVIITDGPRPIRIRDRHRAESEISPPAIREVSPTGSGDVLLACVLEALLIRKRSLAEAVAFAIPFAAANAAHPGIAEFPLPANC